MDSSLEPAFVALVRDAAALLSTAICLHAEIRKPYSNEAYLTELIDNFYRMKCQAAQTRAQSTAQEAEWVLALLRSESRTSPILDAFEYAKRLEEIIWRRVLLCLPPPVMRMSRDFLEPSKRLYFPDGSSKLTKPPPPCEVDQKMIRDDELNEALAVLAEPTPIRAKLLRDEVLGIPNFDVMRDAMDREYGLATRYLQLPDAERAEFLVGISGGRGKQVDDYDSLRQWVADNLGGGQRRLVEGLISAGGTMPMPDLQTEANIGDLNRDIGRLRAKLKRVGWTIRRRDNKARLVRIDT